MKQSFIDFKDQAFNDLDIFPGASWTILAEPVDQGSIHRLKMKEGSLIPPHVHPVDEYVYVLSGIIKTADRVCEKGTFWKTPAEVRQGPHEAITDVEIITIRLGPMGEFDQT
jgi:anti-sigma factor ChrR (cupin superfamily)